MPPSMNPAVELTPSLPAGRGAPARAARGTCFHCGLDIPAGVRLEVEAGGERQPVCCAGCEAAVLTVLGLGLGEYYRRRERTAPRPEAGRLAALRAWDEPALQRQYVRELAEGEREVSLMLEGVSCPACIWLNERRLAELPGVSDVAANFATQRLRVRWQPARTRLSDVLGAILSLGYRAFPYDPARVQAAFESERKRQLRRLGVAGAFGMQVMMVAFGLYAGDWYGMDPAFRDYFNWVALVLSLPVVSYAAWPFYTAAWRDLGNRRTGMDVPVSLAIITATLGSLWTTLGGHGPTYYDSVTMFVFLLLGARYLEFIGRARAAGEVERLASSRPASASRLSRGEHGEEVEEQVPLASLAPGDRVRVPPGASVPADGLIERGRSSIDQSLLTGESLPVPCAEGGEVVGGSVNVEGPLVIRITRVGEDSVLGHLLSLIERSQSERPRITALADRAAGWFTAAVVLVAALAAVLWWYLDPARALPVAISVLVVSCPCALGIAAPAALTAGSARLLRSGVLVARALGLERLARATHVVFDKTGTLTRGRLALLRAEPLGEADEAAAAHWLRMAAALERGSEHPVARALLEAAGETAAGLEAEQVEHRPGEGVEGRVQGRRLRLGRAGFAGPAGNAGPPAPPEAACTEVWLAVDGEPVCRFLLADRLRPEAVDVVAALRRAGLQTSLLSGDGQGAVAPLARRLGIGHFRAGCLPDDKLREVRRLQAAGARVVMVGDGINDAPVLAGADVSVAIGQGADLARTHADLVMLGNDLHALEEAVLGARRTLAVVRQNLAWAVGYNLVFLPAALAGWIAPWLAALGMSASSLLVVLNAARLAPPQVQERPVWKPSISSSP